MRSGVTAIETLRGLAWQPGSGLMFQTEHGPSFFEGKGSGGDEVNIVEAGKISAGPISITTKNAMEWSRRCSNIGPRVHPRADVLQRLGISDYEG
ncbi:MAG: hypothetical protein IPP63_17855 [Chloracidobacterium sp.]|nr:hypothetical protein [Chloracidobacterium sp.]